MILCVVSTPSRHTFELRAVPVRAVLALIDSARCLLSEDQQGGRELRFRISGGSMYQGG